MYRAYIKPAIDTVIAGLSLIILFPLFLMIGLAIKLDSKGPILFKQKRIGKHKQLFYIYKFRTMDTNTPKDVPTHLFNQADLHITRVGKILRKTSLDELPQLVNILKGDMSLIGPRPALWNQDDLIAERDRYQVHDLRPGLTGWAQINGRDELSVLDKARLDGEYVKQLTVLFDIKCLMKTVSYVIKREGLMEGAFHPIQVRKMKANKP